jgi:outer membrane lipoprotein
MRFARVVTVLTLTALSGCVTVPTPLQGDYAASLPSPDTPPAQKVRWGGEIIHVDTQAQRTCIEVLARRLDSSSRPARRDDSGGRFLACRAGFYDPAVFEPGREITVTGSVDGSELRKVGDYDYRYPRVAADVIYLWREPVAYDRYADPWYPWGWDPFFYRPFGPPVYIIHSHRGHRH